MWQPSYASAAELKSFIADGSSGSDNELAFAVETASRSVEFACNRQFGIVDEPQARLYTASYDLIDSRRQWVVEIDDLQTTDGLIVESGGAQVFTPITDYLPHPVNAVVNGRPWTKLVVNSSSPVTPNGGDHGVRVTASFGWTEVPPSVKQATLIQASRLFARRHAPFGILGSPETGGELRLLEKLDPDLLVSVRPYVRIWGAV